MESLPKDHQDILDNKYIIKEKKGKGGTAEVYLVEDKDSKKEYAAKILNKEYDFFFEKEIECLEIVSSIKSNYIINLISSGKGPLIREGKTKPSVQYLILEYAEKGNLLDYIYYTNKGLKEKYAKVIFAKILRGIQDCHFLGICHRDIKLVNILLDKNFNPKIVDFGFATKIKGPNGDNLLYDILGTPGFLAPEIIEKKPYNGEKVDIFCLGILLLYLVTGKEGFTIAHPGDKLYRILMQKNYKMYWNRVSSQISGISQELKNLYQKMVSSDPKSRPSVYQILMEDPWLKEIRDLNEEQLQQLYEDIAKEFIEREKIVKEKKKEVVNSGH